MTTRPPEDPRDLGYLFVVTYGRSGSTLLMGLLNSIPGYLVRGENWDALHHLFRFHRTLAEGSQRWDPARLRQRTHPFFGAGDFPVQKSLEGTRRLVLDTVLRPRDDTRVTGFKEIRWYGDDVVEYVAWLREVFPGARFVVNTRDHAEVRRSGWWAKRPENAEQLPAIEERHPGPGRGARRRGVPRPLQRLRRRPVRAAWAVRLAGRAVRRGRGAVGAGDAPLGPRRAPTRRASASARPTERSAAGCCSGRAVADLVERVAAVDQDDLVARLAAGHRCRSRPRP